MWMWQRPKSEEIKPKDNNNNNEDKFNYAEAIAYIDESNMDLSPSMRFFAKDTKKIFRMLETFEKDGKIGKLLCGLCEIGWGNRLIKLLPQYQLSDKIYKMLGGNINPLLSVPMTFALTDLLVHQILVPMMLDLAQGKIPSTQLLIDCSLVQCMVWSALGLPVAFYKHLNNQTRSTISYTPLEEIVVENEEVMKEIGLSYKKVS